ncbi:MAG: membrane protein insertase YidC [Rhodobacteraceae bacterium]|nr:membrane protein insertase YidC [Paracoccaceae bacterium]
MDDQTKNLILATALSMLVIFGWMAFFPPQDLVQPEQTADQTAGTGTGDTAVPSNDTALPATPTELLSPDEIRAATLAKTERIEIKTGRVTGSFSLRGALLDDLSLNDYNVRLNDESEKVTLLSPVQPESGYWAFHAWWSPSKSVEADKLPSAVTEWTVKSGSVLTETTPVTLAWDNGQGLVFERKISIDENYLFTVEQSVQNNTGGAVDLAAYAALTRKGDPDIKGFFILHEGAISSVDGELIQKPYKKVRKFEDEKNPGTHSEDYAITEDGWVGFTDHFWMTNIIPRSEKSFNSTTQYSDKANRYQTDVRFPAKIIPAGGNYTVVTSIFAGAKEYDAINSYEQALGIPQFIDSIDWGWYFFLTKPIFWLLHNLNSIIGNMGWSIIGLTLVIKALLFPLAYKSFVSMARMKELQPEMEKLKEKAGDDRQKMQQEMMKLYKEKKVNPAAGCLPILLQIPIFFSLYKVIFVTIELRHAPWIGWIKDLSSPDPSSLLNLFGLLPYAPPGPESLLVIFSIGVLPILMGITMWMQQKLNPAPTDPTQAMIFAWMPWVFMFMLGRFAVGLVIYWVANNTITFTQQYIIMRSQGVKPDVFGNIKSGFKRGKAADK